MASSSGQVSAQAYVFRRRVWRQLWDVRKHHHMRFRTVLWSYLHFALKLVSSSQDEHGHSASIVIETSGVTRIFASRWHRLGCSLHQEAGQNLCVCVLIIFLFCLLLGFCLASRSRQASLLSMWLSLPRSKVDHPWSGSFHLQPTLTEHVQLPLWWSHLCQSRSVSACFPC